MKTYTFKVGGEKAFKIKFASDTKACAHAYELAQGGNGNVTVHLGKKKLASAYRGGIDKHPQT